MPLDTSIKKVLVIGSGPIVIGQAAEFDYAGAQACRILKEAGVDVYKRQAFPRPPLEVVSIFILGLIQLMLPRSVIMASPAASRQITTGSGAPSTWYSIWRPPLFVL